MIIGEGDFTVDLSDIVKAVTELLRSNCRPGEYVMFDFWGGLVKLKITVAESKRITDVLPQDKQLTYN